MVDTQCLDKRLERLLGGATLALFLAGLLVVAGLPSGRLMLDVYSLERHGDSVELNDRGEVYYVFLNEAREQLPDVSVWPTLRTLTCSDQIEDLRGIGVCPNVDSLSVPAVSSACHDQFPNLKWLGVGSAYPLSDLRSAKQVETLHLSGQDLSALPTLPTLRQLFLDECKVHSVPSLPQLDVLHMSDCDVDLTSGWDAAWELSGLYISNSSVKGCLSCKRLRSCSVVGATSTQFLGGVKCDDLDVYRPIASAGGLALAGMNVERLGIHLVDCKVDRLVVNGVVAELSMFADRELDMDLAQVQGLRSMRIRLPSESIVAARYPKSLRELKYFTRGGENLDWALRSKVHEDCELIESIR